MCSAPSPRASTFRFATVRALLVASAALTAGACAQQASPLASLTGPQKQDDITTSSMPGPKKDAKQLAPDALRAELKKATDYWGGVFARDPSDAQAAYNYARNLKALGEKQQALAVLQAAVPMNPMHRGLLGEYGRLALEFDQISLAEQVLEKADDPAAPDWRVISARGTARAKQGLYSEAIAFFERALQIAPDQASVMSNLALAYTMEGQPQKAEPLLRRAAAARNSDERVQQNLSLVLGLQGKYDEAKLTAMHGTPPDSANENVDYVRKIVKAQPKPMVPQEPKAEWSTKVVATN